MDSQEIPESIRGDPALLSLYKKVEETSGIRTGPEQLSRLKKHLEDRGGATGGGILEDREELFGLAPLITVNETYFFREGVHFRILFRYLLPLAAKLPRPVRICSAAASSGCEAYSIAMAADFFYRNRALRSGEAPAWELDAFDLSRDMIAAARKGRYGPNTRREDGAEWNPLMDLYLRPGGGGGFEAAGFLRDKIRFFTHNIMEGLAGPYDIIFFRNALIYFSPENRRKALGILAGALTDGGALIVGVSETSSVDDPRLQMLHRRGGFYFARQDPQPFQSPEAAAAVLPVPAVTPPVPAAEEPAAFVPPAAPVMPSPDSAPSPEAARPAGPPEDREARIVPEIGGILEQDEGKANAVRVLGVLGRGGGEELSSACLAAAALSLMNGGDLSSAGLVISSLEERGSSPVVSFLRGEHYYRGADFSAAEAKYQEAAAAESGFWPALYRMGSLAEGGNSIRHRYRLKRALESMDRGAGRGYEVFIGGFSPDYYRRILEKKSAP